jgi:Putative serine esterase (DUF676)
LLSTTLLRDVLVAFLLSFRSSSFNVLAPVLSCRILWMKNDQPNLIWQIDRRLVFIAHSLGGLVVKRALCIARERDAADARSIFNCTKALIFLGTPHRTAEPTSQASILAKFFSLGGPVDDSPINHLDFAGTVASIRGIQKSFEEALQGEGVQISITSFYEELPVPGVGQVILCLNSIMYENF